MNPLSCRALARLLGYPGDDLRAQLPELHAVLQAERAFSSDAHVALDAFAGWLVESDRYEVQEVYVDCFDRGRSTSLWLFEHVHGDSRERGQAMVDLARTYEAAGLYLDEGELPDYLPVVLEFASTQSASIARSFLQETAPILATLHAALLQRGSRYAFAIGAVLELAGEHVDSWSLPAGGQDASAMSRSPSASAVAAASAELPLDETWAEPPAFDGCSLAGQSRPDTPQPIHIVRRRGNPTPPADGRGASS
ncbi:MAG: nitrate reductase molybdenum cofactor assembly chaperone [Burkholderiaceae bacterium]|nr:nitrate reductase molybdenum cofactor assembly chaperone [Burkholderiaceae bacterium]